MHRNEVPKSTNTGRLAVAMLEGATLRVRGRPDEVVGAPPAGKRLVLFPMPDARVLTRADAEGEPPVLIVPDGNWSQARRMLIRDPWASNAEVVRLADLGPTRYPLRRNLRAGTACTLEAVARALAILEDERLEREMLAALRVFVDRVIHMRIDGAGLERRERQGATGPI